MSSEPGAAAGQPLEDLRAAIAGAEAIVAGISAGQWAAPTPCAGVTVRELVSHLVTGNLHFASLISGTPGPGGDEDVLGADPAAAFRLAAAALMSALGSAGALGRTYRLPQGQVTGPGLIEVRLIEHLGHGWDLARATRQPAPFPDDLAERGLAIARRQLQERPAGPRAAFAAKVEVPAGAPGDRPASGLPRQARLTPRRNGQEIAGPGRPGHVVWSV